MEDELFADDRPVNRQGKITQWNRSKDLVMGNNALGEWVPAIPFPEAIRFNRFRCTEQTMGKDAGTGSGENYPGECGKKFWSMDEYRAHYALVHILEGK